MPLIIGTSGWQYRHWRERFYRAGGARDGDLRFFASQFATVEVNNTFYRLPEAKTFETWAAATPDDFTFAIKASRFLTHIKRLRDPREPVELMMDRASKLGRKLAVVLVQLPPDMQCDIARLEATLDAFPGRVRVAVEPRHRSWFTDDVRRALGKHDAALCLADRHSRLATPAWRTADWGYVRFHHGRGQPASCYGRGALASRVDLLDELWPRRADVYVYFNNDGHGCALRDAAVFAHLASARGWAVTRTPEPLSVRVG